MKTPDRSLSIDLLPAQTTGGCCYVPSRTEVTPSTKYIIVYPYTDPSVPFEDLRPEQITFYFHETNKTGHRATWDLLDGKSDTTCNAQCSDCYFQTLPPYAIEPELAQTVANDFRAAGYDIGLITADSFSNQALNKIGEAGSAFRYGTVSVQNGNAWTNGIQISGRKAGEKLDRGWQLGYGVITLSLYDTVIPHPMKGIPPKALIVKAINNIKNWNRDRFPEGGGYKIICTQALSKETMNLDNMRAAAQWCLENGITICRFNAFANFNNSEEARSMELSSSDIHQFWENLALLQEEFIETPLQFGVSEDMSAEGIEACIPYFDPKDNWEKFDPENPYWCRAGYRLFSINGVVNAISGEVEMVISGCVDNWNKAPLGKVVKDKVTGRYKPEFDVAGINRINAAVRSGTISTCWGGVGNPNGREDTRGFIDSAKAEALVFKK